MATQSATTFTGAVALTGENLTMNAVAKPGTVSHTSAGTSFYYVVTALNAAGTETVGSSETSGGSGDNISWSAVTGAASYKVYRGTGMGTEAGYYATTSLSVTGADTVTLTGSSAPPTTTTGSALNITAWSGQTSSNNDPLRIFNQNGTLSFLVNGFGNTQTDEGLQCQGQIGSGAGAGGNLSALYVVPGNNVRGLLVRAPNSSTTNNMIEVQNASDTLVFGVDYNGLINTGIISGCYLCTPTQYAPGSQTLLATPAATTVAAGSNGGEISTIASWGGTYGGNGVLDVATTAAYPTSGTLAVATSTTTGIITYTGTSGGNSFTGCAYVSGSATGTVSTGGAVSLDSLTAISSSNVNTGSFTAPPSGSVVVTASFVGQIGTGSVGYGFGLLGHGTSTLYGSMIVDSDSTTGIRRAKTLPFLVTGLTAGTSYNFDLGIVTSAGDVYTIYAYAPTAASNPNLGSGGQGAPVVMTVQAV